MCNVYYLCMYVYNDDRHNDDGDDDNHHQSKVKVSTRLTSVCYSNEQCCLGSCHNHVIV